MEKEYFVCFDTNTEYVESFIYVEDEIDLRQQVTNVLWNYEGGHADVFNEEGEFVEDIEV